MIKIIKERKSEILKKGNESKSKKILLSFLFICILVVIYVGINCSQLISVYNLEKEVSKKIDNMEIVIGGEAIGIKLLATGVLVMGIDREDTNLEIGDIILKVNDTKIETNKELVDFASDKNNKELSLVVDRKGSLFITKIKPIYDEISEEQRLGLWVKDSSAGVGTITFYDRKSKKFAALGHAVSETKENYILPIVSGGITKTTIYSVKKGVSKVPGELKGSLGIDIIGDIIGNTDKGIYGNILDENYIKDKKEIKILPKSKIKEGKAQIYCTLDDNKITIYDIVIEKVILTSTGNKNMIIKVTDEKLIEKTGGIIQGMSGSPIIQDEKIVGAITHVFLNDPTKGYGVFIENMIEDMSSMK